VGDVTEKTRCSKKLGEKSLESQVCGQPLKKMTNFFVHDFFILTKDKAEPRCIPPALAGGIHGTWRAEPAQSPTLQGVEPAINNSLFLKP